VKLVGTSSQMSAANKIQPATIEGKPLGRIQNRRFSVPETITESFQWVSSGGRSASTMEIPILLALQAFLAFLLIMVPYHLVGVTSDLNWEKLCCSAEQMNSTFDRFDVVRMCSVIGFGWIVSVVSMALIHFVGKLIKMTRRRDYSLYPSAKKTLVTLDFLGPYISSTFGIISMTMLVQRFYPASVNLTEALKMGTKTADDDEAEPVESALSVAISILKLLLSSDSGVDAKVLYFRNLFPIIVNTLAIFMIVLTFEKFFLQMIAVHYRTATTSGRFTENAFALSVLKTLYRTKLDKSLIESIVKPGRTFDIDLTRALFDTLINGGDGSTESSGEIMNLGHLENFMDHQQAAKLFSIFDQAQNGDLTKEEFISSVKAVYDEQETLSKLINDHDDIISKLDSIMLTIVYSADVAICLSLLGIQGVDMFKAILGILVSLALLFSDAMKNLFDALVFVLITHPYDLGDRVEIDGKYLFVESVGLWTTVFNGPGGLKTIMTNASLAQDRIANFRRSPAESEFFNYLVLPNTVTEESVESLRKDCLEFFTEHKRDFLPNWHLEVADQIDTERFKIKIKIFHRHNFQNEEAKNERSQKFALYFKDALIRNGFVFSPSLPRAIATIL
jgi:small-conductance mechanosensitive channel